MTDQRLAPPSPPSTTHVETVIIGAGQAGLATAYHLRRCGRECLVLDGNARIGDNWRTHWDSLRLYSPAGSRRAARAAFPGAEVVLPDQGRGRGLPARRTPRTFDLPVRMRARVERLEAVGDGYVLRLGDERIRADNVVVATGTFGRTPYLPEFALDLDPAIRQLHSSEYRRPGSAPAGSGPGGRRPRTRAPTSPTRSAATHPTILAGRELGRAAGSARPLERAALLAGLPVPGQARRDPTDADRAQGDGRDSVPRRSGPAGQAGRPRPLAASSGCRDRVTGVAGGRPVMRRPGASKCQRRLVHRFPSGVRLDRSADLRRRRLAARDAGGRRGGARPVLLRAGASSTRSVRWSCPASAGMPRNRPAKSTDRRTGAVAV